MSMGNFDVWGGSPHIAYYKVLDATQERIDARCAELCEAAAGCQIWITSTKKPQCWLKTPFKGTGLLNKRGLSGRSIANAIVSTLIRRMMKKVLSYVCGKNAIVDINSILHHSAEVYGSAEFALEVAADFFGTADFSREEPYGNATFPVLAASSNISANNTAVQPLVNDLLRDLRLSLMGDDNKVAEQMATPVGFFMVSFIMECAANPHHCERPLSDAQTQLIV
jgi:hypothetical protein